MNEPITRPKRLTTRRTALGAAVLALALTSVATHEGEARKAYLDIVGVPTICFGYTKGVRIGDTATKEQCQELLVQELEVANYYVSTCLHAPIPDKTRTAFVSLVYNAGPQTVCKPQGSINRYWNSGRYQQACQALKLWVYAGGKKVKGLVNRRAEEYKLCTEGLNETDTN
jgi:lysozyme